MGKDSSLSSDIDLVKEFEELKLKQRILIESLNRKKGSKYDEAILEMNAKLDFLVGLFKDSSANAESDELKMMETKFAEQSAKMDALDKKLDALQTVLLERITKIPSGPATSSVTPTASATPTTTAKATATPTSTATTSSIPLSQVASLTQPPTSATMKSDVKTSTSPITNTKSDTKATTSVTPTATTPTGKTEVKAPVNAPPAPEPDFEVKEKKSWFRK